MSQWILYALGSAAFAALVAVFGKIGLKEVDSTFATTIRAVVMALFLIITSFFLGKFDINSGITSKTFIFVVLSGIAGAISWLFYFTALKHGPAAGVAALDRLSVVFVFILAVLFLGQQFSLKAALGALFVVLGAILLI